MMEDILTYLAVLDQNGSPISPSEIAADIVLRLANKETSF